MEFLSPLAINSFQKTFYAELCLLISLLLSLLVSLEISLKLSSADAILINKGNYCAPLLILAVLSHNSNHSIQFKSLLVRMNV